MEKIKLGSEPRALFTAERVGVGLSGKFIVPPFSVIDGAGGDWQRRKKQWLQLGIKSELGRGADAYFKNQSIKNQSSLNKLKRQKKGRLLYKGGVLDEGEQWSGGKAAWQKTGTSVFDPALCELIYAWFAPAGAQVIDPFAGGSVRGIVSSYMDMDYWGCELRKEQVQANKIQGKELLKEGMPVPVWVKGDSAKKFRWAPDGDLLFSCPPYGNLEVYSEEAGDISNMEYRDFLTAYYKIIQLSISRLKQNSFAVFVVGNFRDKKTGFYYDLVGDTVRGFEAEGVRLYNEIIFVTPRGSLPVRAGKAFSAGRKVGKTHQNVLVFYKGDVKAIKDKFKKSKDK